MFCKLFFLMTPNISIIHFQVLQKLTYVFFPYLYGFIFLHRSLVHLEFILKYDEAAAMLLGSKAMSNLDSILKTETSLGQQCSV